MDLRSKEETIPCSTHQNEMHVEITCRIPGLVPRIFGMALTLKLSVESPVTNATFVARGPYLKSVPCSSQTDHMKRQK